MSRDPLFFIVEQRDPEPPARAEARFKSPVRTQVEIRFLSLDELVDSGHRARLVWAWVERLDLSGFYGKIKARQNTTGRDPVDPRLLSSWRWNNADTIDALLADSLAHPRKAPGGGQRAHRAATARIGAAGRKGSLQTPGCGPPARRPGARAAS